jgi:excisionase family DNA binding protein
MMTTKQTEPVGRSHEPTLRGALQIKEAAAYLSCSVMTVRRWVKLGLLRPNRAMKRYIFAIKELDRFLEDYK